MSEVCNILNKYWLPDKSATKIFLQRTPFTAEHLTLLALSNKKIVVSIAVVFEKIDFLPDFYLFSQWIRCAIFQINTNLLKCTNTDIFLHKILYNPPSFGRFSPNTSLLFSKINWRFLSQRFLEAPTLRRTMFKIKTNFLRGQ